MRKLLLTGLGTGYLPIAPGTWASAGACGLFALLLWAVGPNDWILSGAMAGLALAASAGCAAWGKLLPGWFGKKDPPQCTLDEWAGQAVAFLFLPLGVGWAQRCWPFGGSTSSSLPRPGGPSACLLGSASSRTILSPACTRTSSSRLSCG